MRYSKGICWIEDCRIPISENDDPRISKKYKWGQKPNPFGEAVAKVIGDGWNQQGRFTPNLLVCDDMLNDGIKPNKGHRAKSKVTGYGEFGGGKQEYFGKGEYMEVDSKSRYYDLDLWFDKMLERL
jgi:hypothetical protein